jgi:hypothetical protein
LLSENIFTCGRGVCWQSSGGGFTALAMMMIVSDESHFDQVHVPVYRRRVAGR